MRPSTPQPAAWDTEATRLPVGLEREIRSSILRTAGLLGRAAILLDRRGEIVAANAQAEALLGDGLVESQNRLRAAQRRADGPLQELLKQACWSDPAEEETTLAPVALPCRSGRPLIVRASTVPAEIQSARVLVTLTPLEPAEPPAEATLTQVFGLTSSEARLAREIFRGQGLPAAAETLGVSVNTVRTHLKGVFGKTGAHSQAQLAALLAQVGPGPTRPAPGRTAAATREGLHR